ncbi:MAG: DUF6529 family protein [Actinobacteria bacterium]|nr:DUF6529 family protein [Actinomycetota bacterium]MCL5882933.1 DUF6529 family protein [Actinomycetota bacterium]
MPELTLYQMSVFTTLLLAVAFGQLTVISLGRGWIGDLPVESRRWLIRAHRFGGYIGLFIMVLVSYTCVVYLLPLVGFSPARVAIHDIVGTITIAAVLAKIVIARGLPRFYTALPYFGIVVFGSVVIIWISSAAWYFYYVGFQ